MNTVADIVYESLACVANDFTGPDDDAWHHAISVFLEIYPRQKSGPVGMNPLQQQLAVQLLDKLRENMDGFLSGDLQSFAGDHRSICGESRNSQADSSRHSEGRRGQGLDLLETRVWDDAARGVIEV